MIMERIRKKINSKGFTLVELLICIAIMGILGTTLTGFMLTTTSFYTKNNARSELANIAQDVLSRTSDVVKNALEITVINDEGDVGVLVKYADDTYVRLYYNDAPSKEFGADGKLYLRYYDAVDGINPAVNASPDSITSDVYLFAKDIESFNIIKTENKVRIEISLKRLQEVYSQFTYSTIRSDNYLKDISS